MAQFDVYDNPSIKTAKRAPYLVEVQGNYIDMTSTTVVIPLVKGDAFIPAPVLNPLILFDGAEYYLGTAEITAVFRSVLGRSLGSIRHCRSEVIDAIDRLLQ